MVIFRKNWMKDNLLLDTNLLKMANVQGQKVLNLNTTPALYLRRYGISKLVHTLFTYYQNVKKRKKGVTLASAVDRPSMWH